MLSPRMAHRFSLFILIFILAASAQASPAPIKEITDVLQAQVAAWNRGDLDAYMNGYADDRNTEIASGDTITRGWKALRNHYRKKYRGREQMGHVSFPEVRITILSSDAAAVIGRWQLQRPSDEAHGSFALLMRRRPEGWRIVRDYTAVAGK